MAEDENLKELSLRIERLEKLLEGGAGGGRAARSAANLTPEDIQAFQKVRDVVAQDWGCGVNECFRCIGRCLPCLVCEPICSLCDVECSCGPCNPGGLRGRLGRFGGMG